MKRLRKDWFAVVTDKAVVWKLGQWQAIESEWCGGRCAETRWVPVSWGFEKE